MKLLFKVILLFLILFNFRIPVFYNSTLLSLLLAGSYYLLVRRSIPFTYFFQRYNVTIFIGLFLLSFITCAITFLHQAYEFTLIKAFAIQLLMIGTTTFILPILLEDDKGSKFQQALILICYVFALQGLIILTGIVYPPFGEYMISMKPEEWQAILRGPHDIYFRGYALSGSPFFELPAGFGVAYMAFFRILQDKDKAGLKTWVLYGIFFFLALGTVCTGRTAFVGLGLALLMYVILSKNWIGLLLKTLKYGSMGAILFLVIYSFLLPSNLKAIFTNDIFPFAFEFAYNYEETGELSTNSSDVMIQNHYFWLPDEAFYQGYGIFELESGRYFMGTDAGYMRSILFGGLFFALCLLTYQSLYFFKPLSMARKQEGEEAYFDIALFLMLFIHLFFLEYKSFTIGSQQIMQVLLIFIGSSYIADHNKELS